MSATSWPAPPRACTTPTPARTPRASRCDIVHRDVSPQNILISFDGEVKVIDFGIAQALGRVTQTKTGTRKGKTGYMAPEQARAGPRRPRRRVRPGDRAVGAAVRPPPVRAARRVPHHERAAGRSHPPALRVRRRPARAGGDRHEGAVPRSATSATRAPTSCGRSWTPSSSAPAGSIRASWATPSTPSSRARARCSSPRSRGRPARSAARPDPRCPRSRRWRRCPA